MHKIDNRNAKISKISTDSSGKQLKLLFQPMKHELRCILRFTLLSLVLLNSSAPSMRTVASAGRRILVSLRIKWVI